MFVGRYKELGYDDAPSIRDFISDVPYPEKDAAISYIKSAGKSLACGTGVNVDALTGEVVGLENELRSDGEFSWSTVLAYYVEKHNLILPKPFLSKAASR